MNWFSKDSNALLNLVEWVDYTNSSNTIFRKICIIF